MYKFHQELGNEPQIGSSSSRIGSSPESINRKLAGWLKSNALLLGRLKFFGPMTGSMGFVVVKVVVVVVILL